MNAIVIVCIYAQISGKILGGPQQISSSKFGLSEVGCGKLLLQAIKLVTEMKIKINFVISKYKYHELFFLTNDFSLNLTSHLGWF